MPDKSLFLAADWTLARTPSQLLSVKPGKKSCSMPRRSISSVIEQYRTVTGFIVTPVIGVIPPDLPLEPHEHEVADWFEAPLDFLLDRANQHERTALFRGRTRHYYEIVWNEHRIWGVTAAIIVNLSRRLQWS